MSAIDDDHKDKLIDLYGEELENYISGLIRNNSDEETIQHLIGKVNEIEDEDDDEEEDEDDPWDSEDDNYMKADHFQTKINKLKKLFSETDVTS